MHRTLVGLVLFATACGPSASVDDVADTSGGTADDDEDDDDENGDTTGPSTVDGSDEDDDDADDDGPICLVGDPDRLAFCDIVGGCDADEDCGTGYVCDFQVGYCEPVETCVANADCGGMPCFDQECKHIACVDDRTCGADAICFDGWCTMIDDPPTCDDAYAMVDDSSELPEGPPITGIAYVEPFWGPGIAVARGEDVLAMVNVSGAEHTLEPDVSTAPVIVSELASGYLLSSAPDRPARDLFVGGSGLAMMLATPEGFEAPVPLDDGPAATLDVSLPREAAHAAALVDDGTERRVLFFDGSSGVFELIGEDVAAGDVDDIAIHESVAVVLAVGPSGVEVRELDGGGLEVFDAVGFPAHRPALVGTFVEPEPIGLITSAVATGGDTPMLVVFDHTGPVLVVPLPSTPNAIVAASFGVPAIVVAADTGLDRVFFEDEICIRRLATSIGPKHLAVADEHLDGIHELAIASDTAVAFLREG